MPPLPLPARCEALTLTSKPCEREDLQRVVIDGVARRLCGAHARMARRGPIALWTVPGSEASVVPRGAVPWTAAEDAYLIAHVAHPNASLAEAGQHLGRSTSVVRQRRAALWQERRRGRANQDVGTLSDQDPGTAAPVP